MIRYKIKLKSTSSSTGFFSPEPEGFSFSADCSFDDLKEIIKILKKNCLDDFMKNYAISVILNSKNRETITEALINSGSDEEKTLAMEVMIIADKAQDISIENLYPFSSLTYLKSFSIRKNPSEKAFSKAVFKNIYQHQFPEKNIIPDRNFTPESDKIFIKFQISDMNIFEYKQYRDDCRINDIFNHTLNQFEKNNLIPGSEMQHFTALSPFAILRKWYMKTSIQTKNADFSLEGIQTSYGKGMDIDSARISCLMEMVERFSSFVSVNNNKITTRKLYPEIIHITFKEGLKKGLNMLDPNSLRLDVPYKNEKLFWMKACELSDMSDKKIYIPIQISYLFCNLPEISLFSALDSTGLASGDTKERAKLSGLTEVIERDAEYSSPFIKNNCFRLKAKDEAINTLFNFYKERGIEFFFQDISSELGIPVYKCFVYGEDGVVYKGCSGHINGKKAVLDALFETPYPTHNNLPSKKVPYNIKEIFIEDLPDYSTGSISGDLKLIEDLFIKNNLKIIYSEITRPDIDIPVFRTIVPGLEINGDFDEYTRISKRQYEKLKIIF